MKLLLLLALASCSFRHGALGTGDGPVSDGGGDDGGSDARPIDAMIDVPADARQCWTVTGVGVTVCLTAPLSGSRTISTDTTIDTTDGSSDCAALAATSSDVCVIASGTITIDATQTLAASGARPLVLVANTIDINGTIDVASHVRRRQGPASDLAGCDNGTNADPAKAGGGQGGSFGGKGGDGGNQDGQSNSRGVAGNALTNVTTLRGGCPGGHGGKTSFSLGHGGGAVLLVADLIQIANNAVINASGGSGEKGVTNDQGAGGGGSGGMIALAAASISLDGGGAIFANGGHGGGGSGNNNDGADGSDPTGPTSGGGGGNGGDNAGDGGAGYPSTSRNGGSGNGGGDGGGGGGGGAGIIHFYTANPPTGANISPAATP